MKQVGSRKTTFPPGSPQCIEAMKRMLQLARELRGDKPFMPRGVYRFKTFQEAQEWSLKMISRAKK